MQASRDFSNLDLYRKIQDQGDHMFQDHVMMYICVKLDRKQHKVTARVLMDQFQAAVRRR